MFQLFYDKKHCRYWQKQDSLQNAGCGTPVPWHLLIAILANDIEIATRKVLVVHGTERNILLHI